MQKFTQQIKPHLNQNLIDEDLWLGASGDMERAAAVFFPFYWKHEEPWVLLTKRNEQLKHHSGQVSFPGGAHEPQDKNIKHTALRETFEEIGVARQHIELWGFLDGLPSISGFHVTPFVGEIKDVSELVIDHNEVDKAFGVPFSFFQDHKNRTKHHVKTPWGKKHYYVFEYKKDVIWGLTAQIIVQLVDRMNEENYER
ncbi:CoA pyrophosphatase [Marinicella sp. S1101]|uniref:NUDIX hydrolase n=1 Tax=Marinicella marina TaxID=2996016 RepID=UPI002260B091|nr:CoA pyrophosphatase [Marinicella marina]MCX7554413.1 CoA pyrophosphatase [Marinicella marina]MDJ1140564.1 CoA pyrophosphatase [Marinicella marina]